MRNLRSAISGVNVSENITVSGKQGVVTFAHTPITYTTLVIESRKSSTTQSDVFR